MKILILGAKGNLGSQLVQVYSKENDVFAFDREEVDITNQNDIAGKINKLKPSLIINAAAYNAVDKCEADKNEYKLAMSLNGLAIGYLAKAAIKNKAILIHYSSDYIFPGDKPEGYIEADQPKPVNKYGQSKYAGEVEILKYKEKGLKFYLIRTSKLFGPQGISEITKPSFFDIILQQAENKKNIKVVDEEVSLFTYTPDLANTTKELVKNKKEYGIYHITNAGPCTWYQAAKELFKIAKKDIEVIPVTSDEFPRPAKRPKYSVLLNTKLEPMRDYKEALAEYLKTN
ncbi:MAG: dTDP-4-dehydrorhamnose reductase [Patescibacteria group bacterium]